MAEQVGALPQKIAAVRAGEAQILRPHQGVFVPWVGDGVDAVIPQVGQDGEDHGQHQQGHPKPFRQAPEPCRPGPWDGQSLSCLRRPAAPTAEPAQEGEVAQLPGQRGGQEEQEDHRADG